VSDVRLANSCCAKALREKWENGKVIVCGGCFLPYTATIVVEVDPVTRERTEVPSWWTGLLDTAGHSGCQDEDCDC
jgi:hypothetical protein